jgi:hypothetical protein
MGSVKPQGNRILRDEESMQGTPVRFRTDPPEVKPRFLTQNHRTLTSANPSGIVPTGDQNVDETSCTSMSQKYLLFLGLSAILLSCHGERPTENTSRARQTPEDIQGIWNLKSRDCAKENPEGVSEAPIPGEKFNTIEADDSTLSFYRYPYEYLFSYKYKRKANELFLDGFSDSYQFQLHDSSLFVTEKWKEGDCLERVEKFGRSPGNYNQDTVNPRLLESLKRDIINFEMLTGKWELSTERSMNDGSEPVKLEFPFKIPHVLTFPNPNMDTATSRRIIFLKVNGKKKPFLISLMDDHSFRLSSWQWTLDCPEMIYHKQD